MLLRVYTNLLRGGRWLIERLESRYLLAADLLGTSFDVTPDSLDKDPTITINFTVKNQNGIPFLDDAGAFDVDFYVSSNSTISSADDFIGSSDFTGLGAGKSVSRSVQFTSGMPSVDPFHDDNQYFIGMFIDRIDVVSESDETNNRNRGQGLDRDNVLSEFNLPSPTDGTNFSATSITIGTDVFGSYEDEWIGTRDQDIFAFTASAGKTIRFDYDATSLASSQDAYLRIFNSSWNLVAANDNASAPGEPAGDDPYLAHTFTTAGTYYAVIGGAADSGSNPRLLSDRTAL